MAISTPVNKNHRFLDLDLIKLLAISLMIYDHVIKFLLINFEIEITPTLYYLFILSPFSSAIFLFVSGLLLQYRINIYDNRSQYFYKRISRGMILIAISYLLWISTVTVGHPASTGILQTLGVLWIIGVLINRLIPKGQIIILALLWVSILGLHIWLRQTGISIPFLNTQSFPLLPHSLYFLLGMCLAQLKTKVLPSNHKYFLVTAGASGLILTYLFSGRDILTELIEVPVLFGYWSPSLVLIAYTTFLLIILSSLTLRFAAPAKANLTSTIITKTAQLALPIYIGHLVVLRLLEFKN